MTKKQKKLREKWVEALRSGDYDQGHGCLKSDAGYCCLGVALDVIDPKGWTPTPPGFSAHHRLDAGSPWFLDSETLKRLAISHEDQRALSFLNDSGISFAEIAGVVENLPEPEPGEE